jgi:hypothetical protein
MSPSFALSIAARMIASASPSNIASPRAVTAPQAGVIRG